MTMTEQRIDQRTGRPFGDHGSAIDAINWALDHEDDLYNMEAFLTGWREGDLSEWPEYYQWLAQRGI